MSYDTEIEELKQQIFNKVKKYYELKFKQQPAFVPQQTKINYGGRVFDEKELINLVDSSLEFWLTEGRYAELFKKALSSFIGVAHCVVTNSGSSSNLLAISALTSKKLEEKVRVIPGDEIITTAASFPTTVFPIIQSRAVPVFVDIELDTYNIDTSQLENALSNKTKAVFLAHTLGNPFNLGAVKKFCEDNNLWLIEDNCDALGSKYEGKYTGSFGDISTCSFYPAHHITMGEGGAVLTNNPKLYKIINSLREWGRDCWCKPGIDNTCKKRFQWQLGTLPYGYDHKYTYSELGYNLKITDMQAAIGLAQIEKLPKFIEARITNHRKLSDGLKELEHKLILPHAQKHSIPSWFGFVITLKLSNTITRTELMKKLEENNIQSRLLFAGNIIKQPVFNEMREKQTGFRVIGKLTNTDKVMNDSFWIGVYPGMTANMIDFMITKIHELLNYQQNDVKKSKKD